MGRKFIYLFTILLLDIFYLSTVHAADTKFPFNGGKTSEGVQISALELDGFTIANNNLQIEDNSDYAKVKFYVTVPKGKTASLKYEVFLKVFPSSTGGSTMGATSVTFVARMHGKEKFRHTGKASLSFQGDEITIPAGKHEVFFEASLDGDDCNTTGYIKNLSIHVHQFGTPEVRRQASCTVAGESHVKCAVCGKDSTIKVVPKYTKHDFVLKAASKSSCMSSSDSLFECSRCPVTKSVSSGQRKNHDFDDNGKCRVCSLSIPRCDANKTVYEVYNAGEMRVLSELVMIGSIPGNIGVNIHNDLEFTKDIPMLPLGTPDHPFQGVLNGNGHRILGVYNTYQGYDCLGIVGVAMGTLTSHAVVSNLIFDGANSMKGTACVGGIVGYAKECDIVNCANFGRLEGTNFVGGIVGYADQQVSIQNCAAVTTIRTQGTWNPLACDMQRGRIMNSYCSATLEVDATLDQLPTTNWRHCFSTQNSADGLTLVSQDMLQSYSMVQLLNEESESDCFEMSAIDNYPIPIVSTNVQARANAAIHTPQSAYRRAASVTLSDDDDVPSEKDIREEHEFGLYVDDVTPYRSLLARTTDDVINQDSTLYPDFDRIYIATRNAPEGSEMYKQIEGGELISFESYLIPADSSYVKTTEFEVLESGEVIPSKQTIDQKVGKDERIDQYTVNDDGSYALTARITCENEYDIVYQENINGILKPVWSIETEYDDSGKTKATYAYTYDLVTGETKLEYSSTESNKGRGTSKEDGTYEEYVDNEDNTLHILFKYTDDDDNVIARDHFIFRASDQCLLEARGEKYIDGEFCLFDGMYCLYSADNCYAQMVAYGPVDSDDLTSEVRPYKYHDFLGVWQAESYPMAIKLPTVEQPSIQTRVDNRVYDMQGRVVRQVTDMKDPFSGLPSGLYIYHGTKYLKRN